MVQSSATHIQNIASKHPSDSKRLAGKKEEREERVKKVSLAHDKLTYLGGGGDGILLRLLFLELAVDRSRSAASVREVLN